MRGTEDRMAADALGGKLGNVDCKCNTGREPYYTEYAAHRRSCGATFLGTACESWLFGMVQMLEGRC